MSKFDYPFAFGTGVGEGLISPGTSAIRMAQKFGVFGSAEQELVHQQDVQIWLAKRQAVSEAPHYLEQGIKAYRELDPDIHQLYQESIKAYGGLDDDIKKKIHLQGLNMVGATIGAKFVNKHLKKAIHSRLLGTGTLPGAALRAAVGTAALMYTFKANYNRARLVQAAEQAKSLLADKR